MLHNLSVPKKLSLAFMGMMAACGLATLMVLFSVVSLQKADTADAISSDIYLTSSLVLASGIEQQNAMRGFVSTRDPDFARRFNEQAANYPVLMADLADSDVRGAYLQDQAEIKAAGDVFQRQAAEMMALASDPATQEQAVLNIAGAARLIDLDRGIKGLQAKEAEVGKANAAAKAAAYKKAYWSFALGGALALLIGFVSIHWLVKVVSQPVVAMTRAMGRLASGDLDVHIPAVGRDDEVGKMATAVMTFKQNAEQNRRLEVEAETLRRQADEERRQRDALAEVEAEQDRVAITALAEGMDALARGNLTHRITAPFAPKVVSLKIDFNAAMARLQEAMRVIVDRSAAIEASAIEVSQASDDLSRRTEQQAASLEESAAALEQITATVRRSAEGAVEAGQVVNTAHHEAVQGQAVVNRAITAMGAIEESSSQISNIIGVIDEIAFQTNLLALNAGVEAARAGDAGRGFAVVASEVRALAQRSASAAKEIKVLISASGRQVSEGVGLVGDTGQALHLIADQIGRLTTIAREIAASSQEQATGLQQVNVAVNQMDQMTQQNAAMVEETTAASHSLAGDARELDRLMQQFQLEQGQAGLAKAA